MPHVEILPDAFISDSAIIVRRDILLPPGGRLKRVTIGDYTTACSLMSARLMNKNIASNQAGDSFIDLISKGSAESGEDVSWEGDLPTDGMKLVAIFQASTVGDILRTKALVQFP